MSGASPAAARLHDPVAHSHALGGFLAGAALGLAAAVGAAVVIGAVAGAVATEVATAGMATPLVVGAVATVGEFGLNAVVGGKLMGLAEDEGQALGASSLGAPSGAISAGSPNVKVNGLPAARATDPDSCDASKLAQGSRLVAINGLPATRVGDKTTCGAVVVQGSPNVVIGGPAATMAPIQSEVPAWARWAVVVAGLLPALGGLARAIGPAIAEVEASGFARAAQTGAKALGRAMEARAGKVSPEIETQAARLGVSPATLKGVIDTPKPDRPPPGDYLSDQRMQEHADAFQGGASRFTLQSSVDKYGLGQSDGTTFVMTPTDADAVVNSAGNDPRALEQALGLPVGQLDGDQLVRVNFSPQAMSDLNMRMPSGNEAGANSQWLPGGYLPSGANEAVIDGGSASPNQYTITPIR